MTPELANTIDRVRAYYGEVCFACGRDNSLGLHLEVVDFDDGWVAASFEPRSEYRGAGDTLHGGIAATALDEILVWAGILTERVVTVTGTLDLRFRRRLTVNDKVIARGRVEERRGRRFVMTGYLEGPDGVAVEGRGIYLSSLEIDSL